MLRGFKSKFFKGYTNSKTRETKQDYYYGKNRFDRVVKMLRSNQWFVTTWETINKRDGKITYWYKAIQ